MAAFLIASLPSHLKSLEAVEFMQKNNFSIRISTNVSLMNFLMSSGGGDSRQLEVFEEIEEGKEEVHVIANMTCIFPSEIKVEVDSTENLPPNGNSAPIDRIVKEENDDSATDQPDDRNPRLEIVPEAVQPAYPPLELPIAALENPPIDAEKTEDDIVDDHQKEPVEEMNSFVNQVENDGGMNENVLLTDDHEFDENNAEISMDIPLSVAEQRVQPVQNEPALEKVHQPEEEREEQNVVDEMEGKRNEQQMEDGDVYSMSVDELLEPVDTYDSMSIQPLHNVELEEDLEHETIDCNKEDNEDMEEEEEELIEEQEHEDKNNDYDESEKDEEVDSDVEDDKDVSSDEDFDEADEEEQIQKKKRNGRVAGKSIDCLLFNCPSKNCNFSFSAFEELKDHIEHHRGKRNFFCDVCKKSFSSKDAAMAHVQERKKKECCGCGKNYSAAVDLVRHLRCHTGEKPYVCKTCGKGFSVDHALKRHMLTHTGEKRFSCGDCKKRFALKQDLKIHERTHTGDKPYKCKHCDYRCGDPRSLIVHNRTHTGEKPYSCGYCEKRFSQASNLKSHEVTHTGEKPFECKDCGRKFNNRGNLNVHIRIHIGQKPFSCKKCGATFAHSSSLKYHMKKKHN